MTVPDTASIARWARETRSKRPETIPCPDAVNCGSTLAKNAAPASRTARKRGRRPRKVLRMVRAVSGPGATITTSRPSLYDHVGEALHVGRDDIRRVRGAAKRPPAPVDEGRAHARGFGADAIERVVGDEQDLVHPHAHDLGGFRVRRHMRLERAGDGDRDHRVEWNLVERLGGLEHVGITVREHDDLVTRLQAG